MFNKNKNNVDISELQTDIYNEMTIKKMPLIGNFKIKNQYLILTILMVLSIIISFVFLFYSLSYDKQSVFEKEYFTALKNKTTYSEVININLINNASNNGNGKLFNEIQKEFNILNQNINEINKYKNDFNSLDEQILELKRQNEIMNSKGNYIGSLDQFLNLYKENKLTNNNSIALMFNAKTHLSSIIAQNYDLKDLSNALIKVISNKDSIVNKNLLLSQQNNSIEKIEKLLPIYLTTINKNISMYLLLGSFFFLGLTIIFLCSIFFVYLFEKNRLQVVENKKIFQSETEVFKLISELSVLKNNDLSRLMTVSDNVIGNVALALNNVLEVFVSVITLTKNNSKKMIMKVKILKNMADEMQTNAVVQKGIFNEFQGNLSRVNKKFKENANFVDAINIKSKANVFNTEKSNKNINDLYIKLNSYKDKNKELLTFLNQIVNDYKDMNNVLEFSKDISEQISVIASNASLNNDNNIGGMNDIIVEKINKLSNDSKLASEKSNTKINNNRNNIENMQEIFSNLNNELENIINNNLKNIIEDNEKIYENSTITNELLNSLSQNAAEQYEIITDFEYKNEKLTSAHKKQEEAIDKMKNDFDLLCDSAEEVDKSISRFKTDS